MLVGVLIGGAFAVRVKMIQMPQLVALFNGVGGACFCSGGHTLSPGYRNYSWRVSGFC